MRLTVREKEIVDLLKKEPLISQEELARRLGIARSSIAVHVSNLMRKGVILGRGYVFNERVSGIVLGQAGIETRVVVKSQPVDGRQAEIETRCSGFAFSVGGCLARFGMDVKVLTVLGTDEEGDRLIELLKEQKVDTANIYRPSRGRTTKMVRLFDGGEVVEYRDNFEIGLFQQLMETWEYLVLNCEWLVVEPDLQEVVVKRLLDRGQDKRPALCTLYQAENINHRLPECLAGFYLVVLGVRQENEMEDWLRKGIQLLGEGLENLVVTDGVSRVWVATRQASTEIPLPPNQGFNVDEGLEPFLAGMVYGLSQGYQVRQAVRIGSGVASFTGVNSA